MLLISLAAVLATLAVLRIFSWVLDRIDAHDEASSTYTDAERAEEEWWDRQI